MNFREQWGSSKEALLTRKAHLIANSKSGKGKGASLAQIGQKIAQEVGVELVCHEISELNKAIEIANRESSLVIAAGGDGTIRAVAEKAAEHDVKFGVIGCGTFNFFARNHRIPEDLEQAFRLALTGEIRPVRLGEINGRVFLINASLGLYAKAIKEREVRTSRWGRNRLVVILSTFMSMLSKHRLLSVDLVTKEQSQRVTTPMIFIGNNALQLRNLAMDVARCMKQDLLAVVIMKPLTKMEIVRIFWRGFTKTLEKEDRLESFCVSSLVIHTRRSQETVALDGEMFQMNSPLKVQALPKALQMVLPPKEVL